MSRTVLVPMDDSPPSHAALEHVLSAYPEAELIVLHVIEASMMASYGEAIPAPEANGAALQRAGQLFSAVEQRVGDAGVALSTVTQRGTPARTIVRFAREHDVDHIVMGSHGRDGVKRLLFGSVAEQVARQAPVPVTVVHEPPASNRPVTGR